MLGGLLLNWPLESAAATADNNNQINTIGAVTDNVNWTIVNLDCATDEENLAKLQATPRNYKYLKVVLQTDFCLQNYGFIGAVNHAILDLNGYTISALLNICLMLNAPTVEITDSSVMGGGKDSVRGGYDFHIQACTNFIFSGGFIEGQQYCVDFAQAPQSILIRGGSMQCSNNNRVFSTDVPPTFAPYMSVTRNAKGQVTAFSTPELTFDLPKLAVNDYDQVRWAVSRSDQVSGAYNYVYGYAWELTTMDIATIQITEPGTYYLWCRSDTGWYAYTGLTTAA